jgi:putative tributyrin esterase
MPPRNFGAAFLLAGFVCLNLVAICELHYFSDGLQKQTACNVIIPELPGFKGPYPVYYLLHGLSDDFTMWQRKTSIGRYVQMLPLMIVMPDAGRGFYTDAKEGPAYESSIIQDLIPFIDRTFNTVAERKGRCIGGLSMGGYGAIKLGLKHPDLFVSANGHSGAYGFAHGEWRSEEAEFQRITGPNPIGGPDDVYALAAYADRAKLPALRLDCGTSDFLLKQNRDFHEHLQKIHVPHEYVEFPGAHDWSYWDKHVQSALRFHSKHLGIAKPRVRAGS